MSCQRAKQIWRSSKLESVKSSWDCKKMLDDLQIGIGLDMEGFAADMAIVDAAVSNPPTMDLTPIATEFNAVTNAVGRTVVATSTLDTSGVVSGLEDLQTGMANVSTAATEAQFSVAGMGRAMTGLSIATRPLAVLPGQMGAISGATGLAAAGAAYVAAGFGLASTMATHMAIGLGILIAPLRGLVIVPKLIAASFSAMFAVVLAPFKVLIFGVRTAAKAMWLMLKPVVALAAAAFRLKVFFTSLRIQLKLLGAFFSLLPPKLRIVVGGLIALGAAGRVGSAALNIVARAAGAVAFAAMAIKSPLKAAGFAMLKTATTAVWLAKSVTRATKAMARFAITKTIAGMKSLGSATLNVAGAIGGRLVSAAKSAAVAVGLIAAGAAGWGIKLAADAEQAEIAFTTMLKSGDAAKAVLTELETFAASTPFQLDSLRDGAKQLLNAQVPASDLTNQLTMLGDIAAGTGKPIGDFVRIFAKVKATGKVSLETLNQLAERGVPIYTALQNQLGVSRTEMLKMISSGKVGFADFNAALESTATGAGVFAGGMAAQSQTVSGLFSTLKDNVSFAMRELGVEIINAFDFKGLMATGITMFQSLKAGIASARPAFMATATVVKAAFSAVWEVVSVTFNAITSALGLTSGNFMATFMEWAAVATWSFQQWPNIAQLAFTNVSLWLVQQGAEFVHTFTVRIPAAISWFADNFVDIFKTIGSFVASFFKNMASNIFAIMSEVWEFIASGGTSSFDVAWTPLLEGFENSVKELPNIPDRAIGELERNLMQESENLAGALGNSLATEIDNNMQMLDDFQNQQVTTPEIPDITATNDQTEEEETETTGSKSIGDALDRNSEETLKAIFSANNDDKVAQAQLAAQQKMAKGIQDLADKDPVVIPVAGAFA